MIFSHMWQDLMHQTVLDESFGRMCPRRRESCQIIKCKTIVSYGTRDCDDMG